MMPCAARVISSQPAGVPYLPLAMEDARSLLERLSRRWRRAPREHDKPVNIVEAKDALDYLAEDEHPAASAVFLSKVRAPDSLVVRIQSAHPTPTGSALPRRRALDVIPRALPPPLSVSQSPILSVSLRRTPRRASSPSSSPARWASPARR